MLKAVPLVTAFIAALHISTLPGLASTLPRVDLAKGQGVVSAGILDVNLDYAVLDQWSIGVSLMPMPSGNTWYDPVLSPISAAVRSTYRAGVFQGISIGATLSAGVFTPIITGGMRPSLNPFPNLPILRYQYRAFIQPAVNIAWPLGSEEGHWTFRATLGPVFVLDGPDPFTIPIWPNIELAKPLSPNSELTLFGNSLIGWRGIF